MDSYSYHSPIMEGRKRNTSKQVYIIVLILVIIVVPVIVGAYRFFSLFTKDVDVLVKPAVTPTLTSVVFPTDTPTPLPSPTILPTPTPTVSISKTVDKKTGLDRAKLTIVVENGSGKVGAANAGAQLLKQLGYTVLATRNADAYSYLDVTISVKAAKQAYLSVLKEDLSSVYTIDAADATLAASETADALVIIGK